MRRAHAVLALALLIPWGAFGQTETPTETPTATPTATATGTATSTPAPTVADSTGVCVATGDRADLGSATTINQSPTQLLSLPVTVVSASDPYFFACNFTLFNQGRDEVQATLTMREAGGLFAPVVQTVTLPPATTRTFQLPLQTWQITPGSYTLSCTASAERRRVVIAQTSTYLGAWRLGSSVAGCPGSGGGNLAASGATLKPAVCLNEVVSTAAAASVATTATLPAPTIVNNCFVRTNVAVDGGYSVGLAGAPAMFGSATGALGSTNAADTTLPAPVRVVSSQTLRLTSTHASGAFQNTTGRVRAVCFCDNLEAPTE